MAFTVEYQWRSRDGAVSRLQEFEVEHAQDIAEAAQSVRRAFSALPQFGLYVVSANIRPAGVQLRYELERA